MKFSIALKHILQVVIIQVLLFSFSMSNTLKAQLVRLTSTKPDTLISGSLKDSKGNPIANTTIQFRNINHHVLATTTTNTNGEFTFEISIKNAHDSYLNILDKTVALQDLIALKESEEEGEIKSINLRNKIETPHNKLNNEQIKHLPSGRLDDVINTLDGPGALGR